MLGINGEFTGYGSTQWTQEVTTPVSTPNGVIPVGTYKSNASAFQYLFGPVVSVPIKKVSPFGQVLFGQTNTTLIATTSPSKVVRLAGMDTASLYHGVWRRSRCQHEQARRVPACPTGLGPHTIYQPLYEYE